MHKRRMYAMSQDCHWLQVLRDLPDKLISGGKFYCSNDYPFCLNQLGEPDRNALLLIDATGQSNIAETVSQLRKQGWRYVVVVAADPSSKEAHAVFKEAGGYDYLVKCYTHKSIQNELERCLNEIALQEDRL